MRAAPDSCRGGIHERPGTQRVIRMPAAGSQYATAGARPAAATRSSTRHSHVRPDGRCAADAAMRSAYTSPSRTTR